MTKTLLSFCIVFLFSCTTGEETRQPEQNNIPKALQENKEGSIGEIKKRGSGDLVEDLYEEKLRSSPALKAIENLRDELRDSQRDSVQLFVDFRNKNEQYFTSAGQHLNSLNDSLLRNEITSIIEKNKDLFNNRITPHKSLISMLDRKSISAGEKYTVLMVLVSFEMMKEYQNKKIPDTRSLQAVINEYNRLIQKMDSVINKNK